MKIGEVDSPYKTIFLVCVLSETFIVQVMMIIVFFLYYFFFLLQPDRYKTCRECREKQFELDILSEIDGAENQTH